MKKNKSPAKQNPNPEAQNLPIEGDSNPLDDLDNMPIVAQTDNPGEMPEDSLEESGEILDDETLSQAMISEEEFAALEAGLQDETTFSSVQEESFEDKEDQSQSTMFGSDELDQADDLEQTDSLEAEDDPAFESDSDHTNHDDAYNDVQDNDQMTSQEHNTPENSSGEEEEGYIEPSEYPDLEINNPDQYVTADGEVIDHEGHDHVQFASMQSIDQHGNPIGADEYGQTTGAQAAYVDDEDHKKGFVQAQIERVKKDPIVLGAIVLGVVGALWWFSMGRAPAPKAPSQQYAPEVEMTAVDPVQAPVASEQFSDQYGAPTQENTPMSIEETLEPQALPEADMAMSSSTEVAAPIQSQASDFSASAASSTDEQSFTAEQMKALEAAIVADFNAKLAEKDALIAKLQAQGGGDDANAGAKIQAAQREANRYKRLYEAERKESAQVRAYSEQLYRELVLAANGGQSAVVAKIKSGELPAPEAKSSSSSASSRSSASSSNAARSSELAQSNPGYIAVKAITPTVAVLNVNGQDLYVRVGTTTNGITVKSINTSKNVVYTNIGELKF